jgi:hypothetical protein
MSRETGLTMKAGIVWAFLFQEAPRQGTGWFALLRQPKIGAGELAGIKVSPCSARIGKTLVEVPKS